MRAARVGELAREEAPAPPPASPARAKLAAPARGRNSVAVKLPSVFGSAISMKPPRGQMCSASRSRACPPPRAGGMFSSL